MVCVVTVTSKVVVPLLSGHCNHTVTSVVAVTRKIVVRLFTVCVVAVTSKVLVHISTLQFVW